MSGVQDIFALTKKLKWCWAGHVARITDNRWTKQITEWISLDGKRDKARPKMRWEDEIVKSLGITWAKSSSDRNVWKNYRKVFIQQWIENV